MAKNNKTKTDLPENGGVPAENPQTTVNPWTQNFVQIAQYLVRDYRDKVEVRSEFPLFQKPMKIDAVIIIQEDGLVIDNALMRSFKRHNIIEFKSPNDTLTIQAFDKTISYFYAYLSNEREAEKPPVGFNDVTLTIISVRKPVKVLKMLRDERKYIIIDTETPGIYYITKEGFIPEKIQLVVSSELPDGDGDQSLAWLRSLRNNLTPEEAEKTMRRIGGIGSGSPMLSVVLFILSVNPDILGKVENMTEDPRFKQFLHNIAVKTGAADERAEKMKRKIAKNLLKNGIDAKIVAESTGLDIADVVVIASTERVLNFV